MPGHRFAFDGVRHLLGEPCFHFGLAVEGVNGGRVSRYVQQRERWEFFTVGIKPDLFVRDVHKVGRLKVPDFQHPNFNVGILWWILL